jgi:hypothetical protein
MDVEVTSELVLPDGRPLGIFNGSGVATGDVARDPQVQALARQLGNWIETARAGSATKPGMFDRSLYIAPDSPYQQMNVARHAVIDDDVVSGVLDATEALAFDGGLKWESSSPNDADVFNQIAADLNLDAKIREMWRENVSIDQFVIAKLWDYVDYTVRGKTESGNKKKKKYHVWAPVRLVLLDPAKVVPIGVGPLRQDRLAWNGTKAEIQYDTYLRTSPEPLDPLMQAFFLGRYTPTEEEKVELGKWAISPDNLLEMNPDWVFRHCTTRPDYRKFPDVRMRSVFPLLDLKRQLISSDRATLIGAANYILLIRKGSDAAPATQEEVNNLKAGYNFLAKLPVIISDHRLEIDVIAPKLDFVLKESAYDTLDARILARTLATFVAPGRSGGDKGVSSFSDVLASAIQNRRHMIKRTLEREISRAIVEHPKNEGIFEDRPSLVFTPRTVSVGTSQAILSAMLALRTQREISRDTILEYLGLDQATEAQRLELEEQIYDDIFKTQVPFSAQPGQPTSGAPATDDGTGQQAPGTPNGTPEAPQNSGRRGGRPLGGGNSRTSPAKTAKPKTSNGNPSTKEED